MATIETPWRDLAAALEGEVVLPDSPRYDEVRRPQIPRFHDVRPQAVVLCRTPEDVVEAVAFARRSGIEVAVRSGGHDFAGRSSGPGMVLDLTPMHSLEVSDGIATVGPAWELSEATWQEMIDVNLTGAWKTIKATVPHMIQQDSGGSIILTSSIAGLQAFPNLDHYTAAKHRVTGLMRTLAVELAPHRIRVNSVHLTTVDTPMVST
jgi:NAD(P)-dependent dehydrogenase (short-subunit alcohol dehydrogenase family)